MRAVRIEGGRVQVADVPDPALVLARHTATLLTEAEYRNVQSDLKKLFSQFVKAQPDLRDHPDVKKLIEEAVAISA